MDAVMKRVFIGYREVAGYFGGLSEGFEALGAKVSFAELHRHPFAYRPDRSPWIIRRLRASLARNPSGLRTKLWKLGTALWIALLHDVVIISALESLFTTHRFLECRIARMFRKKVIFMLTGSDCRPGFCDFFGLQTTEGKPVASQALCRLNRMRAERVAQAEDCSNAVVGNPLFSQFSHRKTCNFYEIGFPITSATLDTPTPRLPEAPFRILHSPSHPALKGSARIRAVIESLRTLGFLIEYRELTGVPNSEVIKALHWCDLVVDQIYSDTPMAGLACEAAMHGKATLVAGYGWPDFERHVRPERRPPTFTCLPEQLESHLATLLREPERITAMSRRATAFSATTWSAEEVAGRLLRLACDRAPDHWFFDPQDLRYFLGCGVIPFQVRMMAATIIRSAGREALCLEHVPALAEAVVQFAEAPIDGGELDSRLREIFELEMELQAIDSELDQLRAHLDEYDIALARH